MSTTDLSNFGVGTVVSGVGILAMKGAVAMAIPTLMGWGGTVVAGVGTTMPVWMPAVQYVAGAALMGPALPVVVVGSGLAYAVYCWYGRSCSCKHAPSFLIPFEPPGDALQEDKAPTSSTTRSTSHPDCWLKLNTIDVSIEPSDHW